MASSALVAAPSDARHQDSGLGRVEDFTPCMPPNTRILPFHEATRAPLDPEQQIMVRVMLDGEEQDHMLPISPGETIGNLRLRLGHKSWLTANHCLFYGGRELLANQHVADIAELASKAGNSDFLHVFVRLADVHTLDFASRQRAVSFGNLTRPSPASTMQKSPSSSLTASLQSESTGWEIPAINTKPATPTKEIFALDSPSSLMRSASEPSGFDSDAAVIHLIIRKTAQFSWHSVGAGEFELTVKASDTSDELRRRIDPTGTAKSTLTYNGLALDAHKPLSEYGIGKGAVLELVPWEPASDQFSGSYKDGSPMLSSPNHSLFMNWQRANSGLRAGFSPNLAPSGSGGSYFMKDSDNVTVAVFKPIDEEPNAPNNPRGFTPESGSLSASGDALGLRRGIQPGEGARREVAAYVLDHGHRAGVPATAIVFVTMPDGTCKLGSLQDFVKSDCDCEEMGHGCFSIEEVHKIALLDIRLANADRNASNILARKDPVTGSWTLLPIDHGYCLPDSLEDITFDWSFWPQAKVPFSEEAREYIAALDPCEDLKLLADRDLAIRDPCERVFKTANLVLKKVAALGLSPAHAADIMQRRSLGKSPLEKLHREACIAAVREESDEIQEDSQTAMIPAVKRRGFTEPKSDAKYLGQMSLLLDTYLEEFILETVN